MASTLANISLTTRLAPKADTPNNTTKSIPTYNHHPWRSLHTHHSKRANFAVYAAPDTEKMSDKVAESIKSAEQACADDPVSGECAAAWDEVEEVSAAASDARLKKKEKESDPLETYCKDNPETEECRTYDN
ncbi:hypothetical protein Syun_028701 [Stephania yunnanensis]|uniref:CP12 domain-containing protein n=1 Tax=Stephania yunnanensis TaxID=152371 RepID=A0AAP0HIS4_9MAGN